MLQKQLRKAIFGIIRRSPKKIRDAFFQARLNLKPLPDDIYFEIARNQTDLDQAFRLLHDAYVREGFSKPHFSGLRVTDYHALPSTSTLVAKHKAEVIATITIIRDGPFGIPADAVIDLSSYRNEGVRLGEVSSLAIHPRFRGRSGEIMFHLFKYMLHYSMYYFGLDRFIIVVNPNRITLYESVLAFERLRPDIVQSYPFANNAPGVCATLDLVSLDDTIRKIYEGRPESKNIYRFFFGGYSPNEKRQFHFPERPFFTAADPVMSPEIMDYFFNQCTDAFCSLEDRKLQILQSIYSEDGYNPVWPEGAVPQWRNHRRHRRFDVVCTGALLARSKILTAMEILDASRTGVRLRSTLPLMGVRPPMIKIAVGHQKSAYIQADFRWQRGATVGLEIVDADQCWDHFIDYMERRITRMASTTDHETSDPLYEPSDCIGAVDQ